MLWINFLNSSAWRSTTYTLLKHCKTTKTSNWFIDIIGKHLDQFKFSWKRRRKKPAICVENSHLNGRHVFKTRASTASLYHKNRLNLFLREGVKRAFNGWKSPLHYITVISLRYFLKFNFHYREVRELLLPNGFRVS